MYLVAVVAAQSRKVLFGVNLFKLFESFMNFPGLIFVCFPSYISMELHKISDSFTPLIQDSQLQVPSAKVRKSCPNLSRKQNASCWHIYCSRANLCPKDKYSVISNSCLSFLFVFIFDYKFNSLKTSRAVNPTTSGPLIQELGMLRGCDLGSTFMGRKTIKQCAILPPAGIWKNQKMRQKVRFHPLQSAGAIKLSWAVPGSYNIPLKVDSLPGPNKSCQTHHGY